MDPLDFLDESQLLRFFRSHKTEMSCMENPFTFIRQLRDNNLIPEDKSTKLCRMKSKENIKGAIYDILDWLEKERSEHIKAFWRCIFKDVILNNYPTIKMMYNSLMDGSFAFDSPLPEIAAKEEKKKTSSSKSLSAKRKKQENSGTKKRKLQSDDNENPGPSAKETSSQKKKPKKLSFSSPLKKGEKGDIWTWPLYKSQLPVTCRDTKGLLDRKRLSKGQKCILSGTETKRWYSPSEFERLAGRGSSKNWKLSIRCQGTTLKKLIENGHLKVPSGKRRKIKGKTKEFLPPTNISTSESSDFEGVESGLEELEDSFSSGEEENFTNETVVEATEQQGDRRFKVTCSALSGVLYQRRFASGTNGKCIRTETAWMSPTEFLREANPNQTNGSWRRDIIHDGKPLSNLLTGEILRIHSLLCKCCLCKPSQEDLKNQENDDECFICKNEGKLVVCEDCPKSFHPKCHLPQVEERALSDNQPWTCTFCIFRHLQSCRYNNEQQTEALTSFSVAQHMAECEYLLLHLISSAEEQITSLEERPSFMASPMWFSSIVEKLQKRQYQTVGEFVHDVHLIFTSGSSEHRNSESFVRNQLRQLFDEELEVVFNIQSSATE